jgi:hypothetical protein
MSNIGRLAPAIPSGYHRMFEELIFSNETKDTFMAENRHRDRMVFECPTEVKRAIRVRAGMDGISAVAVIVSALRIYLPEEIAAAKKRLDEEPPSAPSRRRQARAAGGDKSEE